MLTHTFSILFYFYLFFYLSVDISLSIDLFFIHRVSKFLAQVHMTETTETASFALIILQKHVSLLF